MSVRKTIAEALASGYPEEIASAFLAAGYGQQLELVDESITNSPAAVVFTLTDPAALVQSVRLVSGGAAAAGARFIGDAGATESATVCTVDQVVAAAGLSTTVTLEGTGGVLRVTYLKRANPAQYVIDDMVDNSLTDPSAAQLYEKADR